MTSGPRASTHRSSARSASGDPAALGALDVALGGELMVAGRAGLQVLSGVPAPGTAEVTYAAAPYGVGYVVARWTW